MPFISNCGLNGGRDEKIWHYAKTSSLSILTFDSDLYDLALVRGIPSKTIWMRTGNLTTSEIRNLLVQNKIAIHDFLNDFDNKKQYVCSWFQDFIKPFLALQKLQPRTRKVGFAGSDCSVLSCSS